MKPEEFAHYIDTQLREGIPKSTLKSNLQAGGWSQEEIDHAFADHEKKVRRELLPSRFNHFSLRESILLVLLFLLVMLSILFYLGGQSY